MPETFGEPNPLGTTPGAGATVGTGGSTGVGAGVGVGTGGAAGMGAETASGRSDGDVLTARDKFRRVTEEVRRGAEAARERYSDAAENLRLGYDRVRLQAGDYGGQLNTYVRDNPGKSVLFAAAAGFLLGLLIRRGQDEDED